MKKSTIITIGVIALLVVAYFVVKPQLEKKN